MQRKKQEFETLPLFDQSPQLIIIDEIVKMECLSAKFRDLVISLLNAPALVIASIALKASVLSMKSNTEVMFIVT